MLCSLWIMHQSAMSLKIYYGRSARAFLILPIISYVARSTELRGSHESDASRLQCFRTSWT